MVRPGPRFPMEVAFVETVAVDRQPAQDRMEFFENAFNVPAHPGEPCVGPSGSHMQHKDMLLAGPRGKLQKRVAAKADSIQKRQRHGSAFISKASMLRSNLI